MSEVVNAMLYTLFDSKVTTSIFEMTWMKEQDKLYRDRNRENLSIYITDDKPTYFLENKPYFLKKENYHFSSSDHTM